MHGRYNSTDTEKQSCKLQMTLQVYDTAPRLLNFKLIPFPVSPHTFFDFTTCMEMEEGEGRDFLLELSPFKAKHTQ